MEYVNGRWSCWPVLAAYSHAADTLALSNAVYELGYTPMVISPTISRDGSEKLFVYYDRLAKDVKENSYLYNFPPRIDIPSPPETIRRLIDANPNIIGPKDLRVHPGHPIWCRAVDGKPFTVYSGF